MCVCSCAHTEHTYVRIQNIFTCMRMCKEQPHIRIQNMLMYTYKACSCAHVCRTCHICIQYSSCTEHVIYEYRTCPCTHMHRTCTCTYAVHAHVHIQTTLLYTYSMIMYTYRAWSCIHTVHAHVHIQDPFLYTYSTCSCTHALHASVHMLYRTCQCMHMEGTKHSHVSRLNTFMHAYVHSTVM
jgi:hypothetical protein